MPLFLLLFGGVAIAALVASSSARAPGANPGGGTGGAGGSGGSGGATIPPDQCEKLLAAVPAPFNQMIAMASSVADLQTVASALDGAGMHAEAQCLRAKAAAGVGKATTGGAAIPGISTIAATTPPADCTFSDIPPTVATPPGFPAPIAPGMDLLVGAVGSQFAQLKSAKNAAGMDWLAMVLNGMGYTASAACVARWAAYFRATAPTGTVASTGVGAPTPRGGGQPSLHDLFDAQLKHGGAGPIGAAGAPMQASAPAGFAGMHVAPGRAHPDAGIAMPAQPPGGSGGTQISIAPTAPAPAAHSPDSPIGAGTGTWDLGALGF